MEEANPILLEYLDLEKTTDKIDFLFRKREDMTERLLSDIALCEDLVLSDGSLDVQYDSLYRALQTKAKYEVGRF